MIENFCYHYFVTKYDISYNEEDQNYGLEIFRKKKILVKKNVSVCSSEPRTLSSEPSFLITTRPPSPLL